MKESVYSKMGPLKFSNCRGKGIENIEAVIQDFWEIYALWELQKEDTEEQNAYLNK